MRYFIIIFIFFFLNSASNANEFNGIFGFKLGKHIEQREVLNTSGYGQLMNEVENFFKLIDIPFTQFYYEELQSLGDPNLKDYIENVQPIISNENFSYYQIAYSPLSHRIIEIFAVGSGTSDKLRCKEKSHQIYDYLVSKYSINYEVISELSNKDKVFTGKDIIYIWDKNNSQNKKNEDYFSEIFKENFIINNEYKKIIYDNILKLRNDYNEIQEFSLELICNNKRFQVVLTSPTMDEMNIKERNIIKKLSELSRNAFITSEADKSGF